MPIAIPNERKGDQEGALIRAPPLSEEARAKLGEMRARVNAWNLSKGMAQWADDACLYRYLRARQYNVEKALAMLENSIRWREEFGMSRMLTDYINEIQQMGEVGCTYVHGKDKAGRPVVYMKPRIPIPCNPNHKQQIRHLVYTLERAISMMEGDVEKYVFLIDFSGYSLKNAPSLSIQRESLAIFQDQYPERLGAAILLDAPFLFHQTFKLIKPFMDPVTVRKVIFLSGAEKEAYLAAHFNADELETEYGGRDPHTYNPAEYFATIPAIKG